MIVEGGRCWLGDGNMVHICMIGRYLSWLREVYIMREENVRYKGTKNRGTLNLYPLLYSGHRDAKKQINLFCYLPRHDNSTKSLSDF
jgi:hypothetical protein